MRAALLLSALMILSGLALLRRAAAPPPYAPPPSPAAARPAPMSPGPRLMPKPRARKKPPAAKRHELVVPAPEGFRPANTGAKIKLTLIPESDFIHRGASFWYRLELQNVGSEALEWSESRSFFEEGYLFNEQFQFFLTQPDGQVVRMLPPSDYEEPPGASPLSLTLKPGETLVTRPWSYLGLPKLNWGPFRELASQYYFTALGAYRIHATLRPRGGLTPVDSNPVVFEVVP